MRSTGTTGEFVLDLCAASPYAITALACRRSGSTSAAYGSPLCRPPSSTTAGRVIPSIATSAELTFVAFESLIQSTPPYSPTVSRRCGSARNARSAVRDEPARVGRTVLLVEVHHGQHGGERVRHVVVADQRQVAPRHQRLFADARTARPPRGRTTRPPRYARRSSSPRPRGRARNIDSLSSAFSTVRERASEFRNSSILSA